jgi:hypothetical protein
MSCREIFSLPVLLALVISIALKIGLIVLTPVGVASSAVNLSSYNDELAHVHYSSHLLETASLPAQSEAIDVAGAIARAEFENYQPPLYYALTAGLCKVARIRSAKGIALIARVLNLLLSLCCAVIGIALARRSGLSVSAAGAGLIVISLNGCFIRFGSTATNDMLLWCASGLLFLLTLRWIEDSSLGTVLQWITVAVIGLYTKLSIIVLFPLLTLILFRKKSRGIVAVSLALFIPLVLALPLWYRNLTQFGSLLPLSAGFGTPHFRLPGLETWIHAARSFFDPYQELWHERIDIALMVPLLLFFLLTLSSMRGWPSRFRRPLIFAALLSLSAFTLLNMNYSQAEAKYLFVSWPAWMFFFAMPALAAPRGHWLLLGASLLPLVPLARALVER